ncbi:enoyl-CoA hydratase-related protein [Novosphingobium tardum]|uniref:Enoyl-CoA hydratase-related protein n=1 Tax=Novosphingobium tardum TaxID=1538021 RepID=A0ABV8RQJ1_9SPHN
MTAPFQHIVVDRAGPVTTVTLSRPEVMNAINPAMHDELEAAFNAFADEPAQEICVVTGAGERAFCAGSDLKAVASSGGHRSYPPHGYAGLIERFDCNKPFIAAVNGLALGGGFEIALACDIVIAADSASFGLPEPLVGAVALGGGVHRLARQIGLKQAMGMILAARRVDAAEGARLGFVTEVVPTGELKQATERWCDQILRCSPQALAASKETVMRGLAERGIAEAMAAQGAYPAFAAWREGEDAREGPLAFAEKRAPRWHGRA